MQNSEIITENKKLLDRLIVKEQSNTNDSLQILQNRGKQFIPLRRKAPSSSINITEEVSTMYQKINDELHVKIKELPEKLLNMVLQDIRIVDVDTNTLLYESIIVQFLYKLYNNLTNIANYCPIMFKSFKTEKGELVIERPDPAIPNKIKTEVIKNYSLFYLKLFMFYTFIMVSDDLSKQYSESLYNNIGLTSNILEYVSAKLTESGKEFLSGPKSQDNSIINVKRYYEEIVLSTNFNEDVKTVIFLNSIYSILHKLSNIYNTIVRRKNSYNKLLNKTKEFVICLNSHNNCISAYDKYNNLEFKFNNLNISVNHLDPVNIGPLGFNIISTNGLQNVLSNYEKITLKSFKINKQAFITPLNNKKLYLYLTGVRTDLNYYNTLMDRVDFSWYGTVQEEENFYKFIPNNNMNYLTYSNLNINTSYLGFYLTDNPGRENRLHTKILTFDLYPENIFNLNYSPVEDISLLNINNIKKINFFKLNDSYDPVPITLYTSLLKDSNDESEIVDLLLKNWPFNNNSKEKFLKYDLSLGVNASSPLLTEYGITPFVTTQNVTLNINNWQITQVYRSLTSSSNTSNEQQSVTPSVTLTNQLIQENSIYNDDDYVPRNTFSLNKSVKEQSLYVVGYFTPSYSQQLNADLYEIEGELEYYDETSILRGYSNFEPTSRMVCEVSITENFIVFNNLFENKEFTLMLTSLTSLNVGYQFSGSIIKKIGENQYLLDMTNNLTIYSQFTIPEEAQIDFTVEYEIKYLHTTFSSVLIYPYVYVCKGSWTINPTVKQNNLFMQYTEGMISLYQNMGNYQDYYNLTIQKDIIPNITSQGITIDNFIEETNFITNGPNTKYLLISDLSNTIEQKTITVTIKEETNVVNTPMGTVPTPPGAVPTPPGALPNTKTITLSVYHNNELLVSDSVSSGTSDAVGFTENSYNQEITLKSNPIIGHQWVQQLPVLTSSYLAAIVNSNSIILDNLNYEFVLANPLYTNVSVNFVANSNITGSLDNNVFSGQVDLYSYIVSSLFIPKDINILAIQSITNITKINSLSSDYTCTLEIQDTSSNIQVVDNCIFNSMFDFNLTNVEIISYTNGILLMKSKTSTAIKANCTSTNNIEIYGTANGNNDLLTLTGFQLSSSIYSGTMELASQEAGNIQITNITDNGQSGGNYLYSVDCFINNQFYTSLQLTCSTQLVSTNVQIKGILANQSISSVSLYDPITLQMTLQLDYSQLRFVGSSLNSGIINGTAYGAYFSCDVVDNTISLKSSSTTQQIIQKRVDYQIDNYLFTQYLYIKSDSVDDTMDLNNAGELSIINASSPATVNNTFANLFKVNLSVSLLIPDNEITNNQYNYNSNNVDKTLVSYTLTDLYLLPITVNLNNLDQFYPPVVYTFVENVYPNLIKLPFTWLYGTNGTNYNLTEAYSSSKPIRVNNQLTIREYELIAISIIIQNNVELKLHSYITVANSMVKSPKNSPISSNPNGSFIPANLMIKSPKNLGTNFKGICIDNVCYVVNNGEFVECELIDSVITGLIEFEITSLYKINRSNDFVINNDDSSKVYRCKVISEAILSLLEIETLLLYHAITVQPIQGGTHENGKIALFTEMAKQTPTNSDKINKIIDIYNFLIDNYNIKIKTINSTINTINSVQEYCFVQNNWLIEPYLGPEENNCLLNENIKNINIGYSFPILISSDYPVILYAPDKLAQTGFIYMQAVLNNKNNYTSLNIDGEYFAIVNNNKIITITNNILPILVGEYVNITTETYALEAWLTLS